METNVLLKISKLFSNVSLEVERGKALAYSAKNFDRANTSKIPAFNEIKVVVEKVVVEDDECVSGGFVSSDTLKDIIELAEKLHDEESDLILNQYNCTDDYNQVIYNTINRLDVDSFMNDIERYGKEPCRMFPGERHIIESDRIELYRKAVQSASEISGSIMRIRNNFKDPGKTKSFEEPVIKSTKKNPGENQEKHKPFKEYIEIPEGKDVQVEQIEDAISNLLKRPRDFAGVLLSLIYLEYMRPISYGQRAAIFNSMIDRFPIKDGKVVQVRTISYHWNKLAERNKRNEQIPDPDVLNEWIDRIP